jgi:hypothetical protein
MGGAVAMRMEPVAGLHQHAPRRIGQHGTEGVLARGAALGRQRDRAAQQGEVVGHRESPSGPW